MELTAKQKEAVKIAVKRYRDGEKMTVISGYAGAGKAQPIDTMVPTPNGWRKIGELKIGDYVFDRKGLPTKVMGIYPQGEKKVYTLKLKDKRETQCAGDHLWTVLNKKNQKQTLTTEELLNKGLTNSAGFKYAVPNNLPVQYEKQDYKIDPYVIGAFLGDGCCKQRQLTISSENEQIPIFIKDLIGAKDVEKNSADNYNWTFLLPTPIEGNGWTTLKFQTNQFFSEFQEEICCAAQDKRIPEIYKRGSIEQRLSLLQGILDTDGSITESNNRFNIRYTSTSLQLILDVKEVLQSLSYSSTITEDKRSNKYSTGKCYNLNINIPNEEKYKLFRLPRKKEIAIKAKNYIKNKNYNKNSIVEIIKENYSAEMICIYVDNEEHLYLTNDFIVTHNTTVVNFIIAALDLDEMDVAYATFTGKAAQVLKDKGNPGATTLHKLLYYNTQMPNGTYMRTKRKELGPKVIVVDEVSMVPSKMIQDLLSFPVYLICCGDPGQLSPIAKDDNNHLLDHPHVFLDQIMRQAAESEIIQVSMKVREGQALEEFHGKEVQIFENDDLTEGMLLWADAVLCATNKKRLSYNNIIRQRLGYSDRLLVPGEKLIFLHNYDNMISDSEEASLTNGTVGFAENIREHEITLPYWLKKSESERIIACYKIDLRLENDDIIRDVIVEKKMLATGTSVLTGSDLYKLRKNKRFNTPLPNDATYGYAATVWKYQGSSAKKVLLIEEGFPFDKEEHKKFMYTGITRAENKLVIIKK